MGIVIGEKSTIEAGDFVIVTVKKFAKTGIIDVINNEDTSAAQRAQLIVPFCFC